jgi:hypothetical protein
MAQTKGNLGVAKQEFGTKKSGRAHKNQGPKAKHVKDYRGQGR